MTRILAIGLAILLAAGSAQAQPAPAPEPMELMDHPDGRHGIWLEMDFATWVLAQGRRVPRLEERLSIAEAQLELRDAELGALRLSFGLVVEERDRLQGRLDSALAWYRSPPLWFGAGGTVVALVAILLAGAL